MANETLNQTVITSVEQLREIHRLQLSEFVLIAVVGAAVYFLGGMMVFWSSEGRAKFFWAWFASTVVFLGALAVVVFKPDWTFEVIQLVQPSG